MTAYLLGAVSGSLPVLIFVRPRWKQLLWLLVMAAFCVFMIYATSTTSILRNSLGMIGGE